MKIKMALMSHKAMQVKVKTTRQGVVIFLQSSLSSYPYEPLIKQFLFYERIFYIYIYCNNKNLIWNTCKYCQIPSKMRHSFSLISFSHKYQCKYMYVHDTEISSMYFHLAKCACFDETGLGDRSKSWAIL